MLIKVIPFLERLHNSLIPEIHSNLVKVHPYKVELEDNIGTAAALCK